MPKVTQLGHGRAKNLNKNSLAAEVILHGLSFVFFVGPMGKQWKQWLILFFWAPKSLQMVIAAMKLKDTYSFEGKL